MKATWPLQLARSVAIGSRCASHYSLINPLLLVFLFVPSSRRCLFSLVSECVCVCVHYTADGSS